MSQIYLGSRVLNPFVLDLTFSPYFQGKTFTVAATGVDTITGVVPSDNHVEVYVPKPNTTYTVTCDGISKTVATESYFGYYACVFNLDLATAPWDTIAAISESGQASNVWNIGDEKDITVGNETITLQIYDFNHDDLSTSGKAGITFGLKNLMASTKAMNSSNTNSGGFTGSAMYTWLQGDLYNSLPSDLKSVIKEVKKKTSAGSQSTTINTNSMKIFLFSEAECFGATTYSVSGEGTQYPIFTDAASRIKKLSNGSGSAYSWWERSPSTSNSTSFCAAGNDGSADSGSASSTRGVCFGFCI